MVNHPSPLRSHQCRPPHGGRGLKLLLSNSIAVEKRRPPHGGRGLKFDVECALYLLYSSPSPRRAWIEITVGKPVPVTLPSPSPRRAWIEIRPYGHGAGAYKGRPPHGGRGLKCSCNPWAAIPRKRRPPHGGRGLKSKSLRIATTIPASPSPRRAWIEIAVTDKGLRAPRIALPTEGVD